MEDKKKDDRDEHEKSEDPGRPLEPHEGEEPPTNPGEVPGPGKSKGP